MNFFKKKIHSIKIKGIIKSLKELIIKYDYIIWMIIPMLLMELFIFLFGLEINYFNTRFYSTIFFICCWLILFIGISLSLKNIWGKISYLFFNILFLILFLVNGVYFSMTKTFFDFSLMESASEGSPYMIDALKNCNGFVYLAIIVIIVFIIVGIKKMPIIKKNNFKQLGKIFLIFICFHLIIPFTLGFNSKDLTWSNWKKPKYIYKTFNDNNKSIKVSGFIEYSIRNFYITFIKSDNQIKEEDIEFLEKAYKSAKKHKNEYTGQYKDKNLILIQLEGMDNWIVSKETTPTIYNMMKNSYNFSKHYSYYNGGGSTFNSEFAVNTGFITPLSFRKNAYSFNKNEFPYSLANLFKAQGYSVNAFHMNNGEYYSRALNYQNWGYDNYYGLIDIQDYKDYTYELDRELILNEQFNKLLFPQEGRFVDYLITYSGHLPFTNEKGVCKLLYDEDIQKQKKKSKKKTIVKEYEMTEEECVRRQAQETDYMMKLLINNLKKKKLLDNTVIVVFTDHYLYTLEDKTILDRYKNTSNNLINNTPFFIWSNDNNKKVIKDVTSQLDILPTVLNLFGIKYNTNNYIGKDALDSSYDGLAFFSDYSWYDGNVYVEDGTVSNKKKMSKTKLEEKNSYVNYITKKNDLTLKYNYFNRKEVK